MPTTAYKILSENLSSIKFALQPEDNRRLLNLCGRFDEHLRQIEQRLSVEINNRANLFQIVGASDAVGIAKELLLKLYEETSVNPELSPHDIHIALQDFARKLNTIPDPATQTLQVPKNIRIKRVKVKPKTANQARYIESIQNNDINFGIGPAGTGKTYLAVACAIEALEDEQVKRILLVRPAVEAGERLGFLPGDLAQKIDPYLRPLFDALYEMLGFERAIKLVERNVIEIAPLAYMRGRTLNDAFVILDEGQNTTIEQMKMFLTRIGYSSKAVITGDVTQIDLPRGTTSGLKHTLEVLKSVKEIKFSYFDSSDVVRHPLVQKIIEAYHSYEQKK